VARARRARPRDHAHGLSRSAPPPTTTSPRWARICSPRSRRASAALKRPDGAIKGVGETVVIPHLADFLERVAAEGSAALFRGDVARALVQAMAEHGGIITQADLDAFVPVVRPAALVGVADWTIATKPAAGDRRSRPRRDAPPARRAPPRQVVGRRPSALGRRAARRS
jgi:hypothetical protein